MPQSILTWFRDDLPCRKNHALAADQAPPCLKPNPDHESIHCPTCVKLHEELEAIKSKAYKSGYEVVAWVVRKGPRCELVCFEFEPDEAELKERYGDDLIAIVPV